MDRLARRFVGNAAVLLAATASAQAMTIVAVLLTARQLGPSVYGGYAACFALSGLGSVAFNLGLDTWLLQEGAKKPARLEELLGSVLLIKILLGIPWVLALRSAAGSVNLTSYPASLMTLSALAIWLDGLFTAGLSALNASLRNYRTALVLLVSKGVLLSSVVLLVARGQDTPVLYALARSVAAGAGVALIARWPGVRVARFDLARIKRIGVEALPFTLSALLVIIYMRVDVTIIAIALDTEATGLYSAASNLITALFFIPGTIHTVAIPFLVSVLQGHDKARTARWLAFTMGGFALIGCCLWGGAWLSARTLPVYLLGGEFTESGPVLSILSPILFLKSLNYALASLLVAAGWQYQRTVPQAFSAAANVGLNALVVRPWGIVGVAWVYVFSETILLIGYAFLGWRWWRAGAKQHISQESTET